MKNPFTNLAFWRSDPCARERLRKMVTEKDIELLSDLFERFEESPEGIDAAQFRVDHQNDREAIENLVKRRFINLCTNVYPWVYRLEFVSIPLIDSAEAQSILDVSDQILGYLKNKYEHAREQEITIAEMSRDLDVEETSIRRALCYLVRTNIIVGTSHSGEPRSTDWWMKPVERSLDLFNTEMLLRQLVEWLPSKNIPASQSAPISGYVKKIIGYPISVIRAIAALVRNLDSIFDLIKRIF